jgi:hypothetical protein
VQQKFSALIGIVGGLVDMVLGLVLLQPPPPMQTMGMRTIMIPPNSLWPGYFLLALGVVVLLTGLYLMSVRMMQHRSSFGLLMLIYGVIMLILAAAMFGQMFFMMQGSALSGIAMVILAVAMLYSGSTMTRG